MTQIKQELRLIMQGEKIVTIPQGGTPVLTFNSIQSVVKSTV